MKTCPECGTETLISKDKVYYCTKCNLKVPEEYVDFDSCPPWPW